MHGKTEEGVSGQYAGVVGGGGEGMKTYLDIDLLARVRLGFDLRLGVFRGVLSHDGRGS